VGIEVFDDDELEQIEKAMLLLGWKVDIRLTTEEAMCIKSIAEEIMELKNNASLSAAKIEDLACKAFDIMAFQVMNPNERAFMVECAYIESQYLKKLVPLIDEALFCYYRGYFTSGLATLFIVIESYLLNLYGWLPGHSKPSFASLRGGINKLAASKARDAAAHILSVIYSNYDAINPTPFYFNRHGLLHGLRGPLDIDRMNCARAVQFFDSICAAEGLDRSLIVSDRFKRRLDAYSQCEYSGREKIVLDRL
jgi:hypothetical protein